jgi:predicted nucleic acid-binding protein
LSAYVLDASVAVKWYVQEVHSEHARRVLASDSDLVAPELAPNEIGSAFLKKIRRGEMRQDIAPIALQHVVQRVRLVSVLDMVVHALAFALDHDRSIFDSFYVLLGMQERCPVVTADERLYNALHETFPGQLLWIEDFRA